MGFSLWDHKIKKINKKNSSTLVVDSAMLEEAILDRVFSCGSSSIGFI